MNELIGYAVMFKVNTPNCKWWLKVAYQTLGIAENAKDNFERDYNNGGEDFLFKVEKIYIKQ